MITVTNKYNLPLPLYRALAADIYDRHGDISATELIKPTQAVILRRRHENEITVEAMDRFFSLRGTALHYAIEKAKLQGSIIEERCLVPYKDITISMKVDYMWQHKPGEYELLDWKSTRIQTIQNGPRSEWVIQLNEYQYGMRKRGFNITSLKDVVFLEDWSWHECHIKKLHDYPPAPIVILPISFWTEKRMENWFDQRIKLFRQAMKLPDNKLPECTAQERWAKPDRWAIDQSSGSKKGHAVSGGAAFRGKEEALQFLYARSKSAKPAELEFRKGENPRCERYCDVKNFCHQYRTKIKTRKDPF